VATARQVGLVGIESLLTEGFKLMVAVCGSLEVQRWRCCHCSVLNSSVPCWAFWSWL